jgi:hypothetical protein
MSRTVAKTTVKAAFNTRAAEDIPYNNTTEFLFDLNQEKNLYARANIMMMAVA